MNKLADYYFSQSGVVLIPVEHLTPAGLTPWYREQLLQHTTLDEPWLALFEAAYACYWQRLAELYRRAPRYWFPPRVQHLCIVTDPIRVRPYFQVFHQSAWLLYADDFNPQQSNEEFAVFQLLQAERMGLMQQVVPSLIANLSYWLLRSEDEVVRFCQACSKTMRLDAPAVRAMAKAMPWLRGAYHESIKPPPPQQIQPLVELPGTGLLLKQARAQDLQRLTKTCTRAAETWVTKYFAEHSTRTHDHTELLCDWLLSARPRLLITGGQGQVLWDYECATQVDAVREPLKNVSDSVAASLQADLAVIDRQTQRFIAALRAPESLPLPQPHSADQNGLSYMHLQRREVAYNLHEAGMQRLREPTPAFERLMLGARTVHEWGHLFVEGGGVPVATALQSEHDQSWQACAELYTEIYAAAPNAVRYRAQGALEQLRQDEESLGHALTRLTFARVEDFQVNLMAQRFLSLGEMETYVRNNHRSHVHNYSPEAYFQRLARYAYEYQYLGFSVIENAFDFFLKTTWFTEQYLDTKIISLENTQRLVAAVGRVCATYRVDELRFKNGKPTGDPYAL